MRSKALKFISIVFSIVIFLSLLGLFSLIYLNNPPSRVDGHDPGVVLKIRQGESLSEIAKELQRENLIRSALFFKLLCKVKGVDTKIKAGYYKISREKTNIDIIDILTKGKQEEIKITFPEGWTISKIARHLESKGITSASDFKKAAHSKKLVEEFGIPGKSLEGFLYPDTYFFPKEFPAELVAEIMVKNFFKHLKKIEPDYTKLTSRQLYQKIILASIVEREYRIKEEAPIIASVFYNRLRRNIGLESCATLEYIITEIEGKKHPEYITIEDKKLNSDYNTYKWAGLPPGPISNPGKVALDAAFHPAKTDYWYFVLEDRKTGKHYFSKSLEEHNRAKYTYLKSVSSGK